MCFSARAQVLTTPHPLPAPPSSHSSCSPLTAHTPVLGHPWPVPAIVPQPVHFPFHFSFSIHLLPFREPTARMLPAPTPPSYSSGHTALPDSVHTPSVTAAPVPRGLDAHDDTPTAPSSFAPTLYHYDGTTDHYATPHHRPSSYLYSPSVPAPPALWPPHTQPHPVLDPHYPYTQDQHVHQSFNHPVRLSSSPPLSNFSLTSPSLQTSDPQIYYSYFPSVLSQFVDVATQYGVDSSSLASYALPAAATLPTSYTAPNLAFVPGVPKLEDFSAQSPLAASTSVPQWPFTWTPPHAAPLPFHRPALISPGSASGLDRALDEQRITLRVVPAPRDPSPAPTLASDAASGSPANTPQPSVLSPPSSSPSSCSPTQVVALVLCSPPPMAHLPLPDEDMQEDFASPAPAVPSEYQFVADPAAFPGPDQPVPVPRKVRPSAMFILLLQR